MILLAQQSYAFAYVLVGLMIFLGLLAVCIPRPRKQFSVEKKRRVRRVRRR